MQNPLLVLSKFCSAFTTYAMSSKPLIVFDLDYTLWPFWVDTHVTPPFSKKSNGDIIDAFGHRIKHYPEVPEILESLRKDGYTLAIASRTSEINGANQLLQLFDWDKYFQYKEIYPGCKVEHFNNFKKKSGIDFKDMIFFDDENRNIIDINKIGATAILVKKGMTLDVLRHGIEKHKNQCS